jgi:hypothetical protein
MHPLAFLIVLVGFCLIVPYLVGGAMAGGGLVAVGLGATDFVTEALAGFKPANPIDHLRIGPPTDQDSKRDPAYRSYYAGPVLLDYRRVLTKTSVQVWGKVVAGDDFAPSLIQRTWSIVGMSDSPYWALFAMPAAVGAIVGLFLGVIGLSGLIIVTSMIFGLLLLCLVLGALGAAGLALVAELAVLWVRGITIECNTCHTRATRPLYRCPSCDAVHRRLVPGLAGVLHRTCRCHTRLPTLLAMGKAKLAAQCASCKTQLPVKGLTAPTVHIPVIAGPTAGKSVFMQTAVTRLMVQSDEDGDRSFEFADAAAKAEFDRNVQLGANDDPSRMAKTIIRRPRAYNVYVGREGTRARRLLYLYDPAGEIVESVEQLADSQFLAFTKGIAFVIDPFSLRAVRSAADRSLLSKVRASDTAAKAVLERFVESLGERFPRTRSNLLRLPAAVIVTKADGLLSIAGSLHPYAALGEAATDPGRRSERNAALREWLCDAAGSRDLVTALENRFAAVAYFAVSYRDAVKVERLPDCGGSAVANDDPASPLLWLLDRKAYS